uniref:Uncharacterized protein n=1 Tax=Ananas comosus var. bracteatus TaxID=296719 RepID=A0A6V7QEE3_ANACO|nr:unnamed protein product [Ananas comosus var. bracteatus]
MGGSIRRPSSHRHTTYYSYMDSTSGQLEPASGARASIPGREYWPEGTAARVRAARAPEPSVNLKAGLLMARTPKPAEESIKDRWRPRKLRKLAWLLMSHRRRSVVELAEAREGAVVEVAKKAPRCQHVSVCKSNGGNWPDKAFRRPPNTDRNCPRKGQKTSVQRRAGTSRTKEIRRDWPDCVLFGWVKAWNRDTSREAVQKHFEETGEDENTQLITMFQHQTAEEYRIMMGTDIRIPRDPLAMRMREDQIKEIWGGDPVYPTVNYIQRSR